jgi:tetratricopeptide (TPR) repeat protein
MSRLEQLQKLAAVSPDDPMAHYAVGLELNNQERWEEAIAAFDASLKADENYSAAYFHKGKAQIKAHQPEAANETLTKGIEVANGAGDWKTAREMTELRDMIG